MQNEEISNPRAHNALTLQTILEARLSRRGFVSGLASVGALAGLCALVPSKALTALSTLTFKEIRKSLTTTHEISEGYIAHVVARWGDRLFADAPYFDIHHQTAEAQRKQFGSNNDYIAFMPLPWGSNNSERGLLCVNHEYTDTKMMFPHVSNEALDVNAEQVNILQAAVGISILEITHTQGRWEYLIGSNYSRRITASTPIAISGPAAGHARLQTHKDPTGKRVCGTISNCAGGITPWGTVLSCEENINDFFAGDPKENREESNHIRMGIGKSRYVQGWYRFDERFHINKEPTEANRFGWVVEYDPYDPDNTPVKRTALGRFKHESATCTLNHDGRVVVYMGDDEKFEYLYRFVSKNTVNFAEKTKNVSLLDEGTLSVARFDEDGTLQWLPLVYGAPPLNEKNGFFSQADVLIETRRAADLLGATPMDRPEDVEISPVSGKVYAVMTKNSDRVEINAANPRAHNIHGHIIELIPPIRHHKPNHAGTTYHWDIFLKGGDPAETPDVLEHPSAVSKEGWVSCPDNLAFDPMGRLWICTDGQNESIHKSDSIYATETEGKNRGVTKLFFNAPLGAEVTGPCFTPDGNTLFVSIQHPGESTAYAHPSTRWPDFDKALPPRSSVIAITKKDNGVVGS